MVIPYVHIRNCLFLAIAILVFMALGCEQKAPRLKVGQKLPDITIKDVSGNDVHLQKAVAGKLGILLFWESGCVYCKREMPLLEPLFTKYRDSGVVIVGVHIGPGIDDIVKAVQDDSLTFPMLEDPDALSRRVYGLVAVPSILVVKPNGTVDEKILGGVPADALEAMIKKKL
jgi:cytochrome c biogenesis protein CcmG/thiol:disulfide interchange protein DsbE